MDHFYSAFCPLVVDSKNNVAFYQYLFLVIFFCCAGWELAGCRDHRAAVTFKVLDRWAMYHVSEWIEGRDKRVLLYVSAFLRTQRPATCRFLHCTWDFNMWGKQWSNSKVPQVLFRCHIPLPQNIHVNEFMQVVLYIIIETAYISI